MALKNNYNDTDPPAPAGRQNAHWSAGAYVGDVRPVSVSVLMNANDLYMYVEGQYANPSEKIWSAMPVRQILLLAGLPRSLISCDVAPTFSVTLAIMLNSATLLGTVNIAAGATTGTFTFSSDITLNGLGDIIHIEAPTSPDPTLAGVRVTFWATRTN